VIQDGGPAVERERLPNHQLSTFLVEGLTVGRQLNAPMKEFYKNDPAKLIEWAITCHIQRVGSKKKIRRRKSRIIR
jgi:ribosomal protein L20A (L18A)